MKWLVLVILLGIASSDAQPSYEDATKLLDALLKNYDPRVRPVITQNQTIVVGFGFTLMDVIEGPGDVFDLQGITKMEWIDPRLRWDPATFGGVDLLYVVPIAPGQPDVLWTPDIQLYRGQTLQASTVPVKAVIYSNGMVSWLPLRVLRVPCSPNAGQQRSVTCELKFMSWTQSKDKLQLQHSNSWTNGTVDIDMLEGAKWVVKKADTRLMEIKYDCCLHAYQHMAYELTFEENKNRTGSDQ